MNIKLKNPASQLVIGLVFIYIAVINHQIVLAKSNNPQKCDISAYVTETDPQGLNVRSGASTNSKILGTIPTNETVQIIAAAGNWMQITNASGGFKGTGWVFVPKLGISTRGYSSNGVDIYAKPHQQSRKIGRIPDNLSITLLGCQRDWAEVEYQGVKGWLAREDQCGAALTTCS